ncbi:MAG: amidohydrolase [Beijerinckiaceae bacterium]
MPVREKISALGLAIALAAVAPAHAQTADTIIFNANIVTLDPGLPRARALAMAGDRIIGVYAQDAPAAAAGRMIDAGGRTVIPGLIDSHIHAIRAGRTFAKEASFEGTRTIAEAMARIRDAAIRADEGDWIVVAGGWTPQQFSEGRRPTSEEIEAAAPERRVYIQLFYRAAFLSEAAQRALGVALESPPHDLIAERDNESGFNGWFAGSVDAITALWEGLPKPGLDAAKAGTRSFFSSLNAYGVTGVIDPGGHNLAPSEYDALFELARDRELTLRVNYFISAPQRGSELDFFKSYTARRRPGAGDAYLMFTGIGERVTFGMYNNDAPGAPDRAAFEDVARWAMISNIPLTVHWNSERSVHHLLEAFGRVGGAQDRARLRWSIAHLHDAGPDTMLALHRLGLGWLTQNAVYFAAPAFIRNMSAARRAAAPPIGSALRTGLKVAAGTDATRVMSYNPFVAMQWMLDGRTVDGQETRAEEERPTREEALRMWTEGGAYFAFAEQDRGRIAPGMLADIAMLDADYMSVPVEKIGAIRSVLTIVGGRIVHASPGFPQ